MKTTVRLFPVFLTILFYNQSLAQSSYKPGSVVTSNGEVIRGQIDYRQWSKNPYSIKFQKTANDEPVSYSVKDLLSFEVDGLDHYVAAVITKTPGRLKWENSKES